MLTLPPCASAPSLNARRALANLLAPLSFSGDFFADRSIGTHRPLVETVSRRKVVEVAVDEGTDPQLPSPPPEIQMRNGKKIKYAENLPDEPIKCLTFKDPIAGTYKKYIFSADGKFLLGGMMVGDVSDFGVFSLYLARIR